MQQQIYDSINTYTENEGREPSIIIMHPEDVTELEESFPFDHFTMEKIAGVSIIKSLDVDRSKFFVAR